MTWIAFGVGFFIGAAAALLLLSVASVCSEDARREARVAKYVKADKTGKS